MVLHGAGQEVDRKEVQGKAVKYQRRRNYVVKIPL